MKTEISTNPLNKKICSLLIAMLFIIMLAISVTTAVDYGVAYDEPVEIKILLMNIKEMAETLLSDESQIAYALYDRGLTAISQNVDRDHGQAAYYPYALYLIKLTNTFADDVEYSLVSNAYHVYTSAICFTAVVAVYFLIRELSENKIVALLGALMLYITPRFFGESHYNNKDIVLLCLLIDMSLFAVRAIKRRKISDALLFAVFAALAANAKIVGIFFFGVMGLGYLLYVTLKKQWNRKSIIVAVITIFSFCLFYYAITPAMWKAPQDFFQHSIYSAFHFQRHSGAVLFDGELLFSTLSQVPRYYLIKYIAITTPIFILLLTLLGLLRLIKLLADKKTYGKAGQWETPFFVLVLCISSLLPLIVSCISKSVVYNGWRHFYFSYFGILLLAIYGLELLCKHYGKIAVPTTAVLIILYGGLLAANHPYEFSYFNILAGANVEERYETDYWGLSSTEALKLVLSDAGDMPEVKVSYLEGVSGQRLEWGEYMLSQDEQKRVVISDDVDTADYLVEIVGYQVMNDCFDIPENFYLCQTIDAFGNKLVNVYKHS